MYSEEERGPAKEGKKKSVMLDGQRYRGDALGAKKKTWYAIDG